MTLTCIDSIEAPETTGHGVPTAVLNAQTVAGYNYGNSWATYSPYCAARPELAAVGRIISIALRPPAGGIRSRCFDIEPGGGHNSEIPEFMEHGADRTWGLPILYTYASNVAAMTSSAHSSGYTQGIDYYVWSAHPGGGQHICAPTVCGYPKADGTQCGYRAGNCDFSLFNDYVFAPIPAPVPIEVPEDESMITATTDGAGRLHVFVAVPHDSADASKGATVYELYQQDDKVHWTGGAAKQQKALAYKLAAIPENVG